MHLLRSRHLCGGLFHMRPTVVWLLAAFTIVSCFAFAIVTVSYLSEQSTLFLPLGRTVNGGEDAFARRQQQRFYAKQTRAVNCAEQQQQQQQQQAIAAPPTTPPKTSLDADRHVAEALITGKIPSPFTNTSLTQYSIMLLADVNASNITGNEIASNAKPESQSANQKSTSSQEEYRYSGNMPLIFIGGMPRSGTTLMRAMLDAHPQVRCGTETRLVPRILSMRAMWLKSPRESTRLHEAGITDDVIDAAVRSFILEIMVRHGELAPRLCNKDPFTLKSAAYLARLFPHAKFIFMIRDGRATVTSIITRQVTITGFNLNDYKQCMEKWNQAMEAMWAQCQAVGSKRCLPVHYEQVVLHPEVQLRRILEFLDLPWNNAVLHHEEHIGENGGVHLSKAERSTDQVIKPVNLDALARWTQTFPDDVHQQLQSVAPMLEVLGYNPLSRNASQYGQPDRFVAVNTDMLSHEDGVWRERQLASVLKGSDSYKFLEREYRLQQQQQQQQTSVAAGQAVRGGGAPAVAVVAAPNLKADFDV